MTDPTRSNLADLERALAESERHLDDGLAVPLEPVLDRLRASIARMEARRRNGTAIARRA